MKQDVVKELGLLALGTRLKRIGERLQAQTQEVLEASGMETPASHFPLLAALAQMPVKRDVRIHTIVGARRRTLTGQPTDGVVTAASAQHPGAASELWVDATHSDLHHDATTIAEVQRILLAHAAATMCDHGEQYSAAAPPRASAVRP